MPIGSGSLVLASRSVPLPPGEAIHRAASCLFKRANLLSSDPNYAR